MPSLVTTVPVAVVPVAVVPVMAVAWLLLVMQLKHFGADFLLQTDWMAHGKCRDRAWMAPLAAHAGLHGAGTLGVALAVAPALWWLGLVDFVVHGAVDRGKALVGRRWRFTTADTRFWWLVGFDQLLHHVTGIVIVVVLLGG